MNIEKETQTIRERIILTVYCIYTLAMTAVVLLFYWPGWIIPVILAGMAVSLGIHLKGCKTYTFRAFFTTVMMWMNLSIYLVNSNDFVGAFSTLAAAMILLAIYCIPQIAYVGGLCFTAHLIWHLLIKADVPINMSQEGVQNLLRIISVYVGQYAAYHLMKTQVESNRKMLDNMVAIKQAEQSKDDFMANMSHEIRTPINTVCGISEMVLREDLSDEARDGIHDIQTAGRQLLSLVSDILDFMELSSGKMEIVPDTYNITSTINDILNIALAKASGKDIEIIVDCDTEIPGGLVGDESKIRRAVMNVVDNAIKFTEEGGVLLTISFRRESYGGNLIVSVKDTGIGMTEDTVDRLFTSFNQADAKRNRQNSGMGLGLSIAKVIVNRMGGFITVESKYGKGTEVLMVFPQQVSHEAPIIQITDAQKCRAMLYLDIEKYHNALVREGYTKCIRHMVEQFGIYYRHCRNLAEVKRRIEKEELTHLFISWTEYCEDKEYFEQISERMQVVLVLDRDHKESVLGSRLFCVYKPFYAMTVASVLNGQYVEQVGKNAARGIRFIAPDACVLVVDDNLMNLRVVEGLLRPYKIKIYVAESGKEALEKVEEEKYDIIFMDHMMPEMDGVETFHRIRKKPGQYYHNVPIVALTANAVGGAREMFLQEGFTDYISKPVELSTLERVLYKLLPDEKIIRNFDENEAQSVQRVNRTGQIPAGQTPAEQTPAGQAPAEREEIRIPGIDVKAGLGYCGNSMEDYLDIVRTYHEIGVKKIEDIKKSYAAGDWKNYTILVHAVKSTSLNIGAVHLSEGAKALEMAGRQGDVDYIRTHTEEVLAEYEEILACIGADERIFPKSDEEEVDVSGLLEIEKDELLEKLSGLSEFLDSFDGDGTLSYIEEQLKGLKYGDTPVKAMLSGIEKMVSDFNYTEAQEELEKLLEDMRG